MAKTYDPAWVLTLYERMIRVREFEDKSSRLYEAGELPGFLHASVGQEAVAVGATAHLRDDDYITSNHRGHGHVIGKGMEPRRMFAELFARADGYNRGKGGSMHIMDFSHGILGANGIVGAGIPIATGAGISIQNRGTNQVVVSFFGDGAMNTGAFHEGINMAAIWDLPVVFVCENNFYAESTPNHTMVRIPDLTARAQAYGIPGMLVDGNDLLAVLEACDIAVQRARAGKGPTLIECRTYRWYGHFTGDPAVYRSEAELADWKARDPIPRAAAWLKDQGVLDDASEEQLVAKIRQEMEAAAEYGESAPKPSPESALEDIYG